MVKTLFNFKIDPELREFLQEYAEKNKMSMGMVLNQLLLKLKREKEDEYGKNKNL